MSLHERILENCIRSIERVKISCSWRGIISEQDTELSFKTLATKLAKHRQTDNDTMSFAKTTELDSEYLNHKMRKSTQKDTYRLRTCGIICAAIRPSSVDFVSDSSRAGGSKVVSLTVEAGSDSSTAGGFDCVCVSCVTAEVSEAVTSAELVSRLPGAASLTARN